VKQEKSGMKFFFTRAAAALCCVSLSIAHIGSSVAQQQQPAFVIVERTATTGPESIQEEYAKLAREILPKYGARYLARSQHNVLLEGDSAAPCCVAILEFPSLEAVTRWYNSPENQDAVKVRDRGARFRLIAIEGLPTQK
jgi:uncharacterized protein (DUF1330 family)